MKTVAVISDTHGLLRDAVKAELAAADCIIHAGDIDNDAVLDTLKQYGELYAVRGNNDKNCTTYLPQTLTVTIEGVRFYIVHNKNNVPRNVEDVDVLVYGHSHKYDATDVDGVLWLNPGSCGKKRFHLEVSMCRLIVDGCAYHIEKIVVP